MGLLSAVSMLARDVPNTQSVVLPVLLPGTAASGVFWAHITFVRIFTYSVVAYARTDPHRMSYVRTVRYGTVRSVREFNNFIGKGAEVVEYEGTQEKEVIILEYIINIYC